MICFRQYADVPPVSRALILRRDTSACVSRDELLERTAPYALHPDTDQGVFVAWLRFYVEMCG